MVLKQKALVEKKLSILKVALEKNPKSIKLAVKRLALSREILDTHTLDRQWQELIFLFPRNFDLWHHYLSFMGTHFTNFTVGKITKAHHTCMERLKAVQFQSFTSFDDKPEGLEDHMMRVFVGYVHFLERSGFREKAIALFQAMVEMNLYSPEFPGYYSLDDRLAMFGQFWESGVPRFGETGAKGWKAYTTSERNDQVQSEAGTDSPEDEAIEKLGPLVSRNSPLA